MSLISINFLEKWRRMLREPTSFYRVKSQARFYKRTILVGGRDGCSGKERFCQTDGTGCGSRSDPVSFTVMLGISVLFLIWTLFSTAERHGLSQGIPIDATFQDTAQTNRRGRSLKLSYKNSIKTQDSQVCPFSNLFLGQERGWE